MNLMIYLNGVSGKLGSLIFVELIKQKYQITSNLSQAKIVIDVTSPQGTKELLEKLEKNNLSPILIIGTTGHENLDFIEKYQSKNKIFYFSNFSQGIRMINEMLSILSKKYNLDNYQITIEETHHLHKKDKPSGTALTLKKSFLSEKDIKIISHREGEVFGDHLIILENENERIEIKHQAKNRELFAKGCVEFIKELEIF